MSIKSVIDNIDLCSLDEIQHCVKDINEYYLMYKASETGDGNLAYSACIYNANINLFVPVWKGVTSDSGCKTKLLLQGYDDRISNASICMLAYKLQDAFREEYKMHLYTKFVHTCVDQKSKEAVARFAQRNNIHCDSKTSIVDVLNDFHSNRKEKALTTKHDRERAALDAINANVSSEPPAAFVSWVYNNCFPQARYFFYEYQKTKIVSGTCSMCGESIKMPKGINGTKGVCSNCGYELEYRSTNKVRSSTIDDYVLLPQRKHGEIYFRLFHVTKTYYNYKQKVSIYETQRIILKNHKAYHLIYDRFKGNYEYRWCYTKDNRPYWYGNQPSYYFDSIPKEQIYNYSIRRLFKGTHIIELANYELSVTNLAKLYGSWVAESLMKMGNVDFALDYIRHLNINECSKIKYQKLHKALGIPKSYLPLMKTLTRSQFLVLKKLAKVKIKLSSSEVSYLVLNHYSVKSIQLVDYIGFSRVREYLIWQSKVLDRDKDYINILYRDYLYNFRPREDLTRKEILGLLLPANIELAHDSVSYKFDITKYNEEDRRKLDKICKTYGKHYQFSDETFMVIAPKGVDNIKEEGVCLDHCVTSYIPKILNGSSVIMFLRRKEEPNKPYCTIECKGPNIVQCRAYHNDKPSAEVQTFIKKYEEFLRA